MSGRPTKQPPLSPHKPVALENTRDWVTIAKRAIEIDPKLDWAVMGVGEKPRINEELTAYSLLAAAERFKNTCEYEERKKLDQKARRFRKEHCQPSRTSQQLPVAQRQSVPPGKG